MADTLVAERDRKGSALRMQRIDCGRTTNGQGENEFFLTRQWLLRIPGAIVKDLWCPGNCIQDCANRIRSYQGRGRGCITATAKMHVDAIHPVWFFISIRCTKVGDG